MKVGLIITALGMGGAETQVADLADHLCLLGHEVLVISMKDELITLPASAGVRVVSLGMSKTLRGVWASYRKAAALLRCFRPDVVHSHMVHANIFARLLRLAAPVPRLICTSHSTYEGGALWTCAYRVTDRLAHLTTSVSQEAVEQSIRRSAVARNRIIAVYNGIDCNRFQFDPAARVALRHTLGTRVATKVLLAAGRYCAAKDYPNLLRAYSMACRQRDDCELWIAGGGDGQQALEAQALELGIAGQVRFLGFRRDVHALMSAADVFVLSSAWEGFPLVVGEAMACERLVVSTSAGGVREWLGASDYLAPPGNSAALADAMSRAISLDDQGRRAHGRRARERVLARYSLASVATRWEAIYQGRFHPDGEWLQPD